MSLTLVLDTETTGLPNSSPLGHPSQPRLVQLAGVLTDPETQREVMRLDVVIYRDEIPARSIESHGITAEFAMKYGVNEGAALHLFEDMIDVADVIIAHNLDFDRKILTNAYRLMYKDPTFDPFAGKNLFCTMQASTPVCRIPRKNGGGVKQPKLSEAHKLLTGEDFDGAHQAINDVLACQRVYFKLMELIAK